MRVILFFVFVLFLTFLISCKNTSDVSQPMEPKEYNLSDIDLSHWKVTLPVGNPTEVQPPEILDYATNELLQKYMFNDSLDGALVFYTEPGSSTANSSYSRTELREQMVPGSNTTNWIFEQGGRMTGTLKVSRVSGEVNNLDRIIVMQIHGRLTDEQRELIGEDDNNAPPVLKIYWDDGKINVRRKVLKDVNVTYEQLLKTDAWEDESHWFDKVVGKEKFSLEVVAKKNSLKVILDGEETMTFDDINVEKWSVFENYFKAGNYLGSKEAGSFSEVKYYDLDVSH